MNTRKFINELQEKGIALRLDGEKIIVKAAPGVLTTDLVNRLKDEKGKLQQVLRHAETSVVDSDHFIPLSPTQFGLWFLNELEGGQSTTYNTSMSFRISGELDKVAFSKSLDAIYNRQNVLRTTFDSVGGEPYQVIGSTGIFPFQYVDLSTYPEGERSAERERIKLFERESPFDLQAGPCTRAILIQESELDYYFILSIHHILTDGWSMGLFKKELSLLYGWFVENLTPPQLPSPLRSQPAVPPSLQSLLPPLSVQYSDYAKSKQAERDSEMSQKSLDYWMNQLRGAPKYLDLKTDRPRPAIQTFKGSVERFRIPPGLHQKLVEFSRTNRSSLFATLLTGLNILLRQYSGQDDIVVGSVTANRVRPEYEDIIGFFANTFVVRTKISDSPTPTELLTRVRAVVFDAQDHQNISFEQIVAALPMKRDPSRSPVFQVMFVLQNTPEHPLEIEGLTVMQDQRAGSSALFDLLFSMNVQGERLGGDVRFNTDLYDKKSIDQLVEDFTLCLMGMVENPDVSIVR